MKHLLKWKRQQKRYISYKLAPTHMHLRNASERANWKWNNHFMAGLATTDPDFTIREQDRLLHQEVITLNLLRNYWVNPRLSDYSYNFGKYDFNKCPMAPPENQVVIHENKYHHTSWDHHVIPDWYIGNLLEHYCTMICYMPTTGM